MDNKNYITIEDAALAINPSAKLKSSPADDADGITWLDGTAPISKADLEAKKAELQVIEDARATQEPIDKASGNQKLLDLGLTQSEIDALIK